MTTVSRWSVVRKRLGSGCRAVVRWAGHLLQALAESEYENARAPRRDEAEIARLNRELVFERHRGWAAERELARVLELDGSVPGLSPAEIERLADSMTREALLEMTREIETGAAR
jgi:hypothetical protein